MTRFLLSLALALLTTLSLSAQFEGDRLFGGATLGYASPTGDFDELADGGLTYTVVGGYKLTNRLAAGFEYGNAITAGVANDLGTGVLGIESYGLTNYFLRGWYTFKDGSFAPYASVGLGLASIEEPDVTINDTTVEGTSRTGFGGDLEIGFNLKNFNVSYTYVLGGKTPEMPAFNPNGGDLGVSYQRFQIGYIYNFSN